MSIRSTKGRPKVKKGQQADAIPKLPEDLFQATVDLNKNDDLIVQRGVDFEHWVAIPSPIGLKDRGDMRRSGQLDTVASNGMIYKKKGCFTAALVSNSKNKRNVDGGVIDYSTARLLVPRFYTNAKDEHIHLAPGDRVFVKDLEVLVPDYQRVEFTGGLDMAQFPIKKIEHVIDSDGIEYTCGIHFKIDHGKIRWVEGKKNPGFDTTTGKGKIYSIRYMYNAHWYVTDIPNEVRVIQETVGDERKATRMPYSAIIQREYVYFNQNNTDKKEEPTVREKNTKDIRTQKSNVEKLKADTADVVVDMNLIE